jgi:hypothetical protein
VGALHAGTDHADAERHRSLPPADHPISRSADQQISRSADRPPARATRPPERAAPGGPAPVQPVRGAGRPRAKPSCCR